MADQFDKDVLQRRLGFFSVRIFDPPAIDCTTAPIAASSGSETFNSTVVGVSFSSPDARRGVAAPPAVGARGERQFEDRVLLHLSLQVRRRVAGQHLPLVDDGQPVAEFVRFGHVVRGEQQRADRASRRSTRGRSSDGARLVTSRPSVGSSRKRIFGSVMKPRQKFIFCRCPVERWLTRLSPCRRGRRPRASCSMRSCAIGGGTP